MTDVVRALLAEVASLEAELAADTRYQKIAKIRELLRMYGETRQPEAIGSRKADAGKPQANPGGRAGSLTSRVLEASTSYLRQKGSRAQTSELTDACVAAGVPLPDTATKQRDYVSSILSHSPRINNVRGQGYGLAEWPAQPSEEDHTASEPPDSVGALSGYSMLDGVLPLSV